jgi:hypothetical protein
LIYHFKMDFPSSNVNRAPAIFFHYHTSYVTRPYSHASTDICWENTILHIVMIMQFNFENNTQILSVKLCIHFFGGPCIYHIRDNFWQNTYFDPLHGFIFSYVIIFTCSEQFPRYLTMNFPFTSLWSPMKKSMNNPGNTLFVSSTENQTEIREGKIPDI